MPEVVEKPGEIIALEELEVPVELRRLFRVPSGNDVGMEVVSEAIGELPELIEEVLGELIEELLIGLAGELVETLAE